MIRMVLIGAAFLAVTITLIVIQPSNPKVDVRADLDALSVTRAQTEFDPVEEIERSLEAQSVTEARSTSLTVETGEADQSPLEAMVIEALRQGQSNDYIDALVNHAADTGKVEVPGSLVTPDGRVDTATLLTVLSKAPDTMRRGGQLYVVRPGDSLASISFRFYGTTEKAPDIFAANEALMGSPRNIAVGQELVIPAQ